jgi:membrane protein implicated in regulation of membrane protease activity
MPVLNLGAMVWIGAALIAAILEVLLPSFSFVFVTIAALAAGLLSAVGFGVTTQVVTFAVLLLTARFLVRPKLVARLGSRGVPSRTDYVLGKRGKVTEPINPTLGTGRINVAGEDWKATSDHPIPAGTDVIVKGADGIVLLVSVAS